MLCHGISFTPHEEAPMLRLRQGEEWINEPLRLHRAFSLRVGELKWCLGHVTLSAHGQRVHHRCPDLRPVKHGTQCPRCQRADQTRFMHQFHKTGQAPEGLRRYLEQPHFLYIASFADGSTKVGTTSTQSKWSRLATQGAVAARYIARASDGAAVRVLEDLLTEHRGLRQQVRQKAKVQGLSAWTHNTESLLDLTAAAAQGARDFLAAQHGLENYGITLLDEPWRQPPYARSVLAAWDERLIHPWDGALAGSTVSVRIRGILGQVLLVDRGPDSDLALLDAAQLKTRDLRLGAARFAEQGGQSALF